MRTSTGESSMNWIRLSCSEGWLEEQQAEELRQFGLGLTFALLVLGGLLLWKGEALSLVFFLFAAVFLISAVFEVRQLSLVHKAVSAVGRRVGWIFTACVLTLTFFLLVTPIGLVLRLLGKDLLALQACKETRSYWRPVEKDGPGSRYYLPY